MAATDTDKDIARFTELTRALRDEIRKVFVGQDEVVDGVLTCVIAGGHVLLEGVPGLGKTLLIRTLAQALDLQFSRVQFTPDLQPKDIIGAIQLIRDDNGSERRVFEPGPLFSNIVLADEVNRATPRTQSALLEAMAEYNVTVGRETHRLPSPYFVLATQNPLEQDGTYPLPEAQLDRFMYKLIVGYPTLEQLDEIMNRTLSPSKVEVKRVMGRDEVLELRDVSQRVGIAPSLQKFALRVLQATHPLEKSAPDLVKKFVREGASPRAGQAILASARVRALMRGEPMVTEQDIVASAVPALRHRLILNFEGEAEGVNRDELIRHLIEKTPRT